MDDLLKQKLLFALVGFNFGVIGYQLIFNSGLFGVDVSWDDFAWGKVAVALIVGLVCGGVTFVASKFLEG